MYAVKFCGLQMAVSPVPSVMFFFTLCSCLPATFPRSSRPRLELLHAFLSLLAFLHVGCHCVQLHEIEGREAKAPSSGCPLFGHRLPHL